MDLTPVHVRGARSKRKRVGSDENVWSRAPRKRAVKTSLPHSAGPSLLQNKSARPRLSRLEQLPNELIQDIFTYCDNISLALSSPFIAQQLSGEKIFYQCAVRLLSCAGRHHQHDSCPCPLGPRSQDIYTLLQRRWMSWSMFQKVVLGIHELTLHKGHSGHTGLEEAYQSQYEEEDAPPEPDFEHPQNQQSLTYLHLDSSVQIPEKLLHGPWSADTAQFLYYLVWMKLGIDWSHSTLGEVAANGLARAIADGQRKVVATLASPVVSVQPTMNMLRLAVVQHGCDKTIVFHLVCAAVRSMIESRGRQRSESSPTDISFRDSSIWSFAGRAPVEKGRWLKDVLRLAADVSSARSQFDEDVLKELIVSGGRESDGVEQIQIPL